jgi:hypothetical protein
MRNLNTTFLSLAFAVFAVAGCNRAEHSDSAATMSTNSLTDLKGETPVRYLCTYCGA